MHLHSSFEALRPSRVQVARILNREDHSDGAYARVVPMSETTVLKATSCVATNLLFEELSALRRQKKHSLEALPAVLKDYGVSVRDASGIQYRVWEVERLFSPDQAHEMAIARVAGRAGLSRFKPAYRKGVPLDSGALLAPLQSALEQERAQLPPDLHWSSCAQLAAAMSVRTEGPLREAFLFLGDFVHRHRVELDMLTQGNVLLDLFGQPVLSDPVTAVWHPAEQPQGPSQECLVLEVPVAILPGFQVKLEHRSTFGLPPDVLPELEKRCTLLQVPCTRVPWGSDTQSRLLQTPARIVSLWAVPDVAKRLATNLYQELLTAS